MSRVIHVSSSEQWSQVMSESRSFGGKAVLVDFTAKWCGPCQRVAPIFDKLSVDNPSVTFLKVDVDELQEVAAECGVRAMPTFIGYLNGAQVETVVGADMAKLQELITTLSKGGATGTGQKLGGADNVPADDSQEDKRARMLAAVEARSKGH